MSRPPLQRPTTYDIDQEQMRHDDALNWFGELTCFLHWWRTEDFERGVHMANGLPLTRCQKCYLSYGDIADAFRQPSLQKCDECYGTTYEGGICNIWYRPAIWNLTPVSEDIVKRGDVLTVRGTIETVSELDLHEGDTAVRRDGTRWQLDQPTWQEITTGFGSQKGIQSRRLRSNASVILEDVTAVVYLPWVDFDALNLDGWLPYEPFHPHPEDRVAPVPRPVPVPRVP